MLDGAQNDTGMAARVLSAHPGAHRYRFGPGWMAWTGTHWAIDRSGSLIETISATVERCIQAAEALPEKQRAAFLKWCTARQNTKALYAVEQRLRTWAGVATAEGWDADPYLLTHAGGTVDLRTGITRPHAQDDLITHCAPAQELFSASVDGSRFGQFLLEVLPDEELRRYVQRAVGSSLIGVQADHVIFIATGTGRNGKGTLFRAIANAVGPYYSAISSDMLVEKGHAAHPTAKADLAGRRLVVSSEINAGVALDEGLVKELSGGDRIKARFMGKDQFEFDPSHTLWICCNEKPRIKGTDNGIWRRIKVIPFVTTIAPENVDRWLDDRLKEERDIVLSWAVEGAMAYLESGLGECFAVDSATSEYRDGEDLLGMALDAVCERYAGATVEPTKLHTAIGRWYHANGYKRTAPPLPTLGKELTRRGYGCGRDDKMRWRTGLSLKPEWDNLKPVGSYDGR